MATSRYQEFLAESDDEDLFKSKPLTKKGQDFEIDFKIDTYRDEIKFNKNGSQKKLLKPGQLHQIHNPSSLDFLGNDQSLINDLIYIAPNDSTLVGGEPYPNDPDMAATNAYLNSLGSMQSLERYKQIEDMVQIPYHEEMGEPNKTILRCADGSFKINHQ